MNKWKSLLKAHAIHGGIFSPLFFLEEPRDICSPGSQVGRWMRVCCFVALLEKEPWCSLVAGVPPPSSWGPGSTGPRGKVHSLQVCFWKRSKLLPYYVFMRLLLLFSINFLTAPGCSSFCFSSDRRTLGDPLGRWNDVPSDSSGELLLKLTRALWSEIYMQDRARTGPFGKCCWASVHVATIFSMMCNVPKGHWSHVQPHPSVPLCPLIVGLTNFQANPSIGPSQPSLAPHSQVLTVFQWEHILAAEEDGVPDSWVNTH